MQPYNKTKLIFFLIDNVVVGDANNEKEFDGDLIVNVFLMKEMTQKIPESLVALKGIKETLVFLTDI